MCFAVEDQTYVTSVIIPFSPKENLFICVWHQSLLNFQPSLRVSWLIWHLVYKSNSWFWWVKKNVVGPLDNVLSLFSIDYSPDFDNLFLHSINWIVPNALIIMAPIVELVSSFLQDSEIFVCIYTKMSMIVMPRTVPCTTVLGQNSPLIAFGTKEEKEEG